jgi:hypothetical protein
VADVTPPWQRDGDGQRSDRGQLFLIGALALAVLFITVALLLNTAIYTENLATRSDGADSAEVLGYQTAAQTHAATELRSVNREHNTSDATPYQDLEENYTTSMDTWDETAAIHQAGKGSVASVTLTDTTDGTRIVQNDTQAFTDANGANNWTLASSANARNYTVAVESSGLETSEVGNLTSDPVFRIVFGSGSVTIYIYEEPLGSDVTIAVKDSNGTDSFDAGSDARIDITNASVNGEHWEKLEFFDELGDDYDVSYENGGNVTGTYSLTVDQQVSTLDDSRYNSDDSGNSPWITPVLYDADFELVYESPETYYQSQYRIAPGEPDA